MPPQPSSIRITAAKGKSFTLDVQDTRGIHFLDAEYGRLPRLIKDRHMRSGCPSKTQFIIPKIKTFILFPRRFYDAAVVTCPISNSDKSAVTHFRIKGGGVKTGHVHLRTKSEQQLLDRVNRDLFRNDVADEMKRALRNRILRGLLLLWLLLLLYRLARRRALGPFFKPQD